MVMRRSASSSPMVATNGRIHSTSHGAAKGIETGADRQLPADGGRKKLLNEVNFDDYDDNNKHMDYA